MFFDMKKRKNLYMFGIVVMALSMIIWTQDLVQPFLSWKIFGEITIGTILGSLMLYATWLFYKGVKLG